MDPEISDAPSWLDKAFVETLLRDNEEDSSIVVQDVTVRPAVGKGENYSSQLHRVAVNLTAGGKPEERHLIVKSLPASDLMMKFIIEGGIFERESRMYLETLPALYGLLTSTPDAGVATLSARCYKTSRPYTIVLDDLSPLGYKMAARHTGLDLQHAKLAVRAIAMIHALSIGLVANDPTAMDFYTEPFYLEEKKEINSQFVGPGIALLSSFVEKWTGFERFGEKLRNVAWVDRVTDLVKVKDGGLVVLNHGDGWTNNMLFKYGETGEVENIVLLDYQIARYASPAMDLQYFLHTSPSQEVREQHWDEVIEEYYKAVVSTLRDIDCEEKAFTLEKLKEEMQEKMLFGLLTACTILPIVLADPQDAPELSKMSEDTMEDNMKIADFGKSFNGTRFRSVFEKVLLHFESVGTI